MSSSSGQVFKFLLCFTEWHGDSRLQTLSKRSDYASVNSVRFFELSGGFPEVTNLPWIDNTDFEFCSREFRHERSFESSGCFQAHSLGVFFFKEFEQFTMSQRIIGDRDEFLSCLEKDIEFVFGDVYANAIVVRVHECESLPC